MTSEHGATPDPVVFRETLCFEEGEDHGIKRDINASLGLVAAAGRTALSYAGGTGWPLLRVPLP
jgi:hypothetical protein